MARALLPAALALVLAASPVNGRPAGPGGHQQHLAAGEGAGGRARDEDLAAAFPQLLQQPSGKTEGAMGCIIIGCMLWACCPLCIWNNERISMKQAKMRLKAHRYALHIDDLEREPLPEMNGRIAYISGTSACCETLTDDSFPLVRSEGKIKLRRIVEMYQWVEQQHEEGEGNDKRTVYSHHQAWSDRPQLVAHDSAKQNARMPVLSTRRQEPYRASVASGSGGECSCADHRNVRLGAYYLSSYVIRELTAWREKTDLTAQILGRDGKEPEADADGWWYFGRDIGALRVRFEELHPGPITICGVLCHTRKGWSFVPIHKKDAGGSGESLMAECGQNCCFSVQELHYADPKMDAELVQALESRQVEIDEATLALFEQSDATTIEAYNPEEDIEDLCCVGPFSQFIVKLMHWIGLEDELLAVAEAPQSLQQLLKAEEASLGGKVNGLRIAAFLGLMLGSYCIMAPFLSLLNYNVWFSLLGGALLSCIICGCGMLCACSSYLCIASTAWMVHRPFLGALGFALAVLCFVGLSVLAGQGERQLEAHRGTTLELVGKVFLAPTGILHGLGNHTNW